MLNDILNDLEDAGANMSSYDVENYIKQNHPAVHRSMKVNNIKAPAIRPAANNASTPSVRTSNPVVNNPGNMGGYGGLKAQFDIKLVRKTALILATLPVPIFGANDIEGSYKRVVAQDLPAGVTITAITKTADKISISYNDGVNTDIVEISSPQVQYVVLVNQLLSNQMTAEKTSEAQPAIRYTLPVDANNGNQLAAQFDIMKITMFGKVVTKDSIPLSSMKLPTQQQNGIVDVPGQYTIDPETSIIVGMSHLNAAGAANINGTVVLSWFITDFRRYGKTGCC